MANLTKRYLSLTQEQNFPNLTRALYEVKSDPTPLANTHIIPAYNCIAFAAGDDTRWWEPDQNQVYYWPISNRDYTVECYIEVFESLGYQKLESGIPAASIHEPGFEKVAIYYSRMGNPWTPRDSPTHAALQTKNGIWKSKLGQDEDIEHLNLECLNGDDITGRIEPYGEPVKIMKRRRGFLGWLTRSFLRVVRLL